MSSPATEEEKISHDKNHISHYQKEASSKSLKVVLAQWAANPNFYDDMINEQSDVLGLAQAMDSKMQVMETEKVKLDAKIGGHKQLQEMCAMFDTDGDGTLDEKELNAALDLIKSLKLAQEEGNHLGKIEALKKEEKLAHLKKEEEEEERMLKHHEGIKARLEERKKKRTEMRGNLEKEAEVVQPELVTEPPKGASGKIQPTL